MKKLTDWTVDYFNLPNEAIAKLIISVLCILILWLIVQLVLTLALRRVDDIRSRYYWRKTTTYISFTIGLLLVGAIWVESLQSLATFLGLLSAGIAIALKDMLMNLVGWMFILWRKPFVVGDRISIGSFAGDVIDIRIFQFTILEIGNWVDADQSTGRVIHIPNGKVFTDPQSNYTVGFSYLWHELSVLVTFESNWRKAKDILTKIVNKHAEKFSKPAEERIKEASRKYMIFFNKLTPIVYTKVEDSGVKLTLRYLVEVRGRRGSEEAMWEDILDEFHKASDIDFAYPTTRFYNNIKEGKSEARAKPEQS